MLVLAGPGSGKTSVITGRTWNLISQYGISPSNILVVTFTKAAAQEMKGRFLRLSGKNTTQVTFGTFHGVYYGILRHAYRLNNSHILSEDKKKILFRELAETFCRDIEDETELVEQLIREVSLVKSNRIALEHYYSACCPEEVFRKIFQSYQETLRKKRLLDFDDIMVWCYDLFQKRPDILAAWQNKFQYILIDEFQDINPIQYDIIRMLAAPQDNLFIVGDDDQSIYRFRGAKPEIMLNFKKDYPRAEQVLLDVNYRSTENIVKSAGRLIANNEKRFQKKIRTVHPKGDPIMIRVFENSRQESEHLTDILLQKKEEGANLSDIAVLFRTNMGSRTLVEQLMSCNIPFQMRDVLPNLYDHWIAADVQTYFSMAMGSRKRSEFLQVMNRPNRYISREALYDQEVSFEQLYAHYEEKEWMIERLEQMEYDLKMMRTMTPFGALNYLRYGVGYENYLKEYAKYRRIKETELLDVLSELQDTTRGFTTFEQWKHHIEQYRVQMRKQLEQQKISQNGVTISTLHSCKGLEYPEVYILDVNEGVMPYQKALSEGDQEEERRMFYVGMTRAKERLNLYYVKERYDKKAEPSRYLEELRPQ